MATLDRFNPVESFQRARSNALAQESQQQGIARETAAAPTRNALADLNLEQAKIGAQRGQTKFDQDLSSRNATIMNQVAKAMLRTPEAQWAGASQSLNPRLAELGLPALDPANLSRQKFEQVVNETQALIISPTGATSSQRERNELIRAVTPALNEQGQIDESKLNATSRSAAIELGLLPRAGTITGQERIATDTDLSTKVTDLKALETSKKETAKLTVQLKLKPEVESAVVSAVAQAKASADISKEDRSNSRALAVYEEAKENLLTALGGTITGPGVGWIPALTAEAQVANGAIAMMAPVLKQLFRSAGEGSFTDQDQAMLLAMVPTRNTLPEARVAQLSAIDTIVNAKLASIPSAGAAPVVETGDFTSSTGIQFTVE